MPEDSKKQQKKNKGKTITDANYDNYFDISGVAPTCECTGMMYSPPHDEDEYESYHELFEDK